MSDTTLPLLPGTEDTDGEGSTSKDRRTLLALGGLAAVALAAGLLVLGGGSAEDELALGLPPGAGPAPAAAPASTPGATPSPAAPPVTAVDDAQALRNPFRALYLPPTAGGAAPGDAAAPAGAAAPATASPVASPVAPADPGGTAGLPAASPVAVPEAVPVAPVAGPLPGTGAGAPAPPPAPAAPAAPARTAIVLTAVRGDEGARTAVFRIDGADEVVAVGDSFGPAAGVLLLSLQEGPADGQWTAVLQVGTGEPFDVVSGARVLLP